MTLPLHIKILAVLGIIKVIEHESKDHKTRTPLNSLNKFNNKQKNSINGILSELPIGPIIGLVVMVLIPLILLFPPSSDTNTRNETISYQPPPVPEEFLNLEAKSFEQLMRLDLPEENKQLLRDWKLSLDNANCENLAKMHRPNIDSVILSYVKYREASLGCGI